MFCLLSLFVAGFVAGLHGCPRGRRRPLLSFFSQVKTLQKQLDAAKREHDLMEAKYLQFKDRVSDFQREQT